VFRDRDSMRGLGKRQDNKDQRNSIEKQRRDDGVNYAGYVVQLELQVDESGERKRTGNE
jgi:hypothetical protein